MVPFLVIGELQDVVLSMLGGLQEVVFRSLSFNKYVLLEGFDIAAINFQRS